MKKSAAPKKAVPAKTSAAAKQVGQPAAAAQTAASSSATKKPLVGKQPQSKQQAALQAGVFLQTNDTWSAAYFNAGDLHCMERELFG